MFVIQFKEGPVAFSKDSRDDICWCVGDRFIPEDRHGAFLSTLRHIEACASCLGAFRSYSSGNLHYHYGLMKAMAHFDPSKVKVVG